MAHQNNSTALVQAPANRGSTFAPPTSRPACAARLRTPPAPGLKGTHLDHTLSEERRLAYLVQHTTLEEQASQMTNSAPSIDRLGIPAYQWLNDDQHSVGRTDGMMLGPVKPTTPKATVLPNG